MSHEIKENDKIVYARYKPWHGIGKKVDNVLTAAEAIMHAGLNWQVVESKVYDNAGRELEGHKAIIRDDTKQCFGIFSNGYTPVQNIDAFKLVDNITGTGLAKYDVVGTLKNGRILFLNVRLPYDFSLFNGKDEIQSNLNFITSHDGSFALQAIESPIRVVCYNTVRAAIGSATAKAYARHTISGVANFADRAKSTLEYTKKYFEQYKEVAQAMAKKQWAELSIDFFLAELFETSKLEKVPTRTLNAIEQIKELHDSGKGSEIPGVRGSSWGLFNAVTEYVDHYRSVQGSNKDESLVYSSLLGTGAQLREKAFQLLIKA